MAQDKITLEKINEVNYKVHTSLGIMKELNEFFSFYAEGYKWNPKYKSRIWDGKIRLFNARSCTLYIGLRDRLEKFCQERDYELEVLTPEDEVEFSIQDATDFVNSLDVSLPDNGKPHDFQIKAFHDSIVNKRNIVISPTGTGKSLIIYFIIRYMLAAEMKGLLMVPSVGLVTQMLSDFKDYSQKNGWDAEKYCHIIYSGKEKNTDKLLTISTWQSIYLKDSKYFSQYEFIIGDEAHECAAKSLTHILSSCVSAEYRIGTTGTLGKSKVNILVLEGLLGKPRKTITTSEGIERKVLSNFQIRCIVLKHPKQKIMKYEDEIKYLIRSEARNNFIRNLALSLEGNTLILFRFTDAHGKLLYSSIQEKVAGTSRKCYYIDGSISAEEREDIRKRMEKETDSILVASMGTFSRGVNIRNLSNAIFAAPNKSEIRTAQSIGRILRKSLAKSIATLYDIADDLKGTRETDNVTLRHFTARYTLYKQERFKVKTTEVKLKG